MGLGTVKTWGSWARPALSCLSLLAVAFIIPACTGGSQNHATPPAFGGLVSATPGGSPGQVVLVWAPAIDFAGGGITYNVFYCIGSKPAQSGSETLQLQTANTTGITVTGLVSADPYLFIVQAVDSKGETDGNTVELATTAP
jgi:hypothetical protein